MNAVFFVLGILVGLVVTLILLVVETNLSSHLCRRTRHISKAVLNSVSGNDDKGFSILGEEDERRKMIRKKFGVKDADEMEDEDFE